MTKLIDKLKQALVIEELFDKNSFWCSDMEKDKFEIFHRFKGTPPTNPPDAEKQIIFSTGKMVELSIVNHMKQLGILVNREDDEEQIRIDMVREGIKITGKLDAMIEDNGELVVCEIKTHYGPAQALDLDNGRPRTSYLKQLAAYMDAKNLSKGILLYMDRGTGAMHQFDLFNGDNLLFTCLSRNKAGVPIETKFDLEREYKRFAEIYTKYILPDKEPESDFIYKIPVEQVDWHALSKTDISKARNNQKVIGSGWQVAYSSYKDLIVAKEAAKYGKTFDEYIGYSTDEQAKIAELTKGYTTWDK